MKQIMSILVFVSGNLFSQFNGAFDVKHTIVKYDGETFIGYIDSIGYDLMFYTPKDSSELDSLRLRKVYYAYNDYQKVFHYSWSFMENIRRMENRPATLFTTHGDTIYLNKLRFRPDMLKPEILIQEKNNKSEFISLFEVEKVVTDYSIMEFSVKRGFYYSFYSFILAAGLNTLNNLEDGRKIPQIWDQYDELLPRLTYVGLMKTGKAYESISFLIPLSIITSMACDIVRNKNEFYFNTIYENKRFGRNMYMFSFSNIIKTQISRIVFKLENTSIGGKLVKFFR